MRGGSSSPAPKGSGTGARRRGPADDRRPSARLAPAGKAPARRRRAGRRRLVDFGLYFFHNARRLIAQGKGPYFYLPKIENHLEARLWNDIFILAQDLLGVPQGTIRATVLIETITAAFEMEEILYELRDHSSGLNAGRWDYIFSLIKNFRTRGPRFVLPDRGQVTMTAAVHARLHRAARSHLPQARRHAIGGMAAFIPNRKDEAANASASRRSAPTRPARPATASTAPGWPTRTSFPSAARCSTPCSATGRTSWTGCARTSPRTTAP